MIVRRGAEKICDNNDLSQNKNRIYVYKKEHLTE